MSDDFNNGADHEDIEDRLIENAYGNRYYTIDALLERTILQFFEEIAERRDLLDGLDTVKTQRNALREAMDYVIATEYVSLTTNEKRWLLNMAHRDVFRLGPLADALADPEISEIVINTWSDISVKRGFGKLQPYANRFETYDHFQHLLAYALAPVGIRVGDDPFLEAGVQIAERSLRLSLTGPPLQRSYTGLIRLHPPQPFRFEDLTEMVPPAGQNILQQIVEKQYGLIVIGDGGMGKTTVFGNLLQFAPEGAALVQRASEVHRDLIPESMTDFSAAPVGAPVTEVFERQLVEAMESTPSALFIDEVHGDEQRGIWDLLSQSAIPVVMTFRGRANTQRLYSALTMAMRRGNPGVEQSEIQDVLLNRLPFAAILSSYAPDRLPRVSVIGQWAPDDNSMLTIEPLLQWEPDQDEPVLTETEPRFPLS